MLGMMNKGGQSSPQGMGQNPNLAALFGSNQAAAPGGAPGMLPQIMAPQTPNIGMPPRPQQPAMGGSFDAANATRLQQVMDKLKATNWRNPGATQKPGRMVFNPPQFRR